MNDNTNSRWTYLARLLLMSGLILTLLDVGDVMGWWWGADGGTLPWPWYGWFIPHCTISCASSTFGLNGSTTDFLSLIIPDMNLNMIVKCDDSEIEFSFFSCYGLDFFFQEKFLLSENFCVNELSIPSSTLSYWYYDEWNEKFFFSSRAFCFKS